MAIFISILMSLGIISNSGNSNSHAHHTGIYDTKHTTDYSATSRGNIEWDENH